MLRSKAGIAHRFEFGRWVVGNVVLHHAVVCHHGAHAACGQLLQSQWGGFKALDVGAGFAQQLLHDFIARGAGLHAHFELLQIIKLCDLGVFFHSNQLHRIKVWLREIHGLLALIGDGDAAGHNIALAAIQRLEDAFPRRIDEFHFKSAFSRCSLEQIHSQAFHFIAGGHFLKRSIGRIRAHGVNLCWGRCRSCHGCGRGGWRWSGSFFLAASHQGERRKCCGEQSAALRRKLGKHQNILQVEKQNLILCSMSANGDIA